MPDRGPHGKLAKLSDVQHVRVARVPVGDAVPTAERTEPRRVGVGPFRFIVALSRS